MFSSSKYLRVLFTIFSKVLQGLMNTKSNCNKLVRNATHSNRSLCEIFISVTDWFQNSWPTSLLNARAVVIFNYRS